VGSEFTYYDLQDRSYEDYTFTYLREEKLQNRSCDVIGMEAKDPAAPYARAEAWVDKSDHFVYQTKLYDKASGQHRKTLLIVETKTLDGCIIPTKVVMENNREGTKTLLALSEVQVNKPLDSGIFSIQNLEKK
jgi:outer membrane lipoprotein-sorting protein